MTCPQRVTGNVPRHAAGYLQSFCFKIYVILIGLDALCSLPAEWKEMSTSCVCVSSLCGIHRFGRVPPSARRYHTSLVQRRQGSSLVTFTGFYHSFFSSENSRFRIDYEVVSFFEDSNCINHKHVRCLMHDAVKPDINGAKLMAFESGDGETVRSEADKMVDGMDFGELCNEFECISSPLVESTARQLVRDILELRQEDRAFGCYAVTVKYKVC